MIALPSTALTHHASTRRPASGTCNEATGACDCIVGWIGPTCETLASACLHRVCLTTATLICANHRTWDQIFARFSFHALTILALAAVNARNCSLQLRCSRREHLLLWTRQEVVRLRSGLARLHGAGTFLSGGPLMRVIEKRKKENCHRRRR